MRLRSRVRRPLLPFLPIACLAAAAAPPALAQPASALDWVLTLAEARSGPRSLSVDRGASGLWQHLLRLQTTASTLYTAAHPDDEQGGVLAWLARGQGARTAMLTLNRGEGGANAVGAELFDGLGLMRTEELLVSNRYYGLDDQYFTDLIDYGYSKNMEESLRQWGRENILREIVRVIRINRPLVVVSRFHGGPQDGHGNHEAAGAATLEAFALAGDPDRFPEQIREEGLRPWQPLKLYRGNPRRGRGGGTPAGPWHAAIDAGAFSSWLGESYEQFAALGLSFQRSQNSGRRRERPGAYRHFFERAASRVKAAERETGFFDGIDTSISGIFRLLGEEPPERVAALPAAIERAVKDAAAAYNVRNPAACAPFLAQGLGLVREAMRLSQGREEALFLLAVKERQFQDALNTALGLRLRAVAAPSAAAQPASPFSPPATMGAAVPGQRFRVDVSLVNPAAMPIRIERLALQGKGDWRIEGGAQAGKTLRSGAVLSTSFTAAAPPDAALSRRYFHRESIGESRYRIREPEYRHLPGRPPALAAAVDYVFGGQSVRAGATVYRREANLPYGYEYRKLQVEPALAVNVSPANLIVPLDAARRRIPLEVELLNNRSGGIEGELTLELPEGWSARPERQAFRFAQAGERRSFAFSVSAPRLRAETYDIEAAARAEGRQYREGYRQIRCRDCDIRYLYREALTRVRGVDVKIAPGLKVGYVMGVGDEVPSGIEQMGAQVALLDSEELAAGDLDAYDTIVIGTRAYAVRRDLIASNRRLLDYARRGGNLIVLYQTQEFVPDKWAAFPADLPRGAEEVSEEDSPVRILAPDHPLLTRPNRIEAADFDGWVEQRGSKFFASWDEAYTPLIETRDRGQEPQRGGWLTARYGEGFYTYFAYAAHRQLPYGVHGAYRIFANLLSQSR